MAKCTEIRELVVEQTVAVRVVVYLKEEDVLGPEGQG